MAVQQEGNIPTPPDNGSPTERGNPYVKFALDHFALLASVIGALIFAVRLVAVSRGDPDTATALLANTSLGDAVRILLLGLLPTLLLISPWVIAAIAGKREGWEAVALLGTSMILIILAIYVSGDIDADWWWWDAVQGEGIVLFIFFVSRWSMKSRRQGREDDRRFSDIIVLLVLGTLVVVAATVGMSSLVGDQFWLPRESLVFADEKTPLIGYVLKNSDDHFVILKDDPRIVIEKHGPADKRDFCYPEHHKKALEEEGRVPPSCPPAPSADPYGPSWPSWPSWIDAIIRRLDS